jgi:uncharacterized protein
MQPVAPRERLPLIDVLRGVALIGILVANMRGFNSPMEVYMKPEILWDSPVDRITQALIDCFVTSKFITIFAVLFGLGFAIHLERADARNQEIVGVYVRRMCGLALFGVAHVVLLWWGDILLTYAVVGLFLMAFRRLEQERLMLWGLMLYWVPVFIFLGFAALSSAGAATAPGLPDASPEAIENAIAIYAGTDFGAQFRQRLVDWEIFNSSAPFFLPRILGFFLFGLWLWRQGALQNPEPHLPWMRRWWPGLMVAGIIGNVVYVAIYQFVSEDPLTPTAANIVMWIASSLGVPALSCFYAIVVILAFQTSRGRKMLQPFALVGRMALTNYLLQSIVGAVIFQGWGLGLFSQVGPLGGLLMAIAIYAVQVALSAVWLGRFRYGPLEWLWRTMTYGRLVHR